VLTIPADGTQPARIIGIRHYSSPARWSPDGRWILYYGRLLNRYEPAEYYAVSPDGSQSILLPEKTGKGLVFGEWLPPSSSILEIGESLEIAFQPTPMPPTAAPFADFLGKWERTTPVRGDWVESYGRVNILSDDEVLFIAIGRGCIEIDCYFYSNYRIPHGELLGTHIKINYDDETYTLTYIMELVAEDQLQLSVTVDFYDTKYKDTQEVVNFTHSE